MPSRETTVLVATVISVIVALVYWQATSPSDSTTAFSLARGLLRGLQHLF